MAQYSVIINGKATICEGTVVEDRNPNNGMPYSVYTVGKMALVAPDGTIGSDDVRVFVRDADAKIRAEEEANFEREYEQAYEDAFKTWKLDHPTATPEEELAYAEHFESLASSRSMRRRRTSGLHVTIVREDGVKLNAYYMRESAQGSPKFRTYVPRDVTQRVETAYNPF